MMMLARVVLLLGVVVVAATAAVPPEQYFLPSELVLIAGYGEEQLSSVFISGELACDVCLRPGSDLLTFDVSGAKVAVACKNEDSKAMVDSAFATTDEYGKFTIDLPSQLHAISNLEKACIVKLLQVPVDSSCRLLHRSKSYSIKLSSSQNGVRTYTTGVIRLNHNSTPSDKCIKTENRSDEREAW